MNGNFEADGTAWMSSNASLKPFEKARSQGDRLLPQRTNAEKLGLVRGAIPSRSWKPGKVWVARDGIFPKTSKCLSEHAPFESSLEARAHLLLSVDHRIHSYVCQPPALHYWLPNQGGGQDKRQYTPDFVALTRDDQLLVIDAKANHFASHEKWLTREPYIRATYRSDYGAELLVWTEVELCAQPRLNNARTLYRHRFAPTDPIIEGALLRLLGTARNPPNIGWLCQQTSMELRRPVAEIFAIIMRLALEGSVELGSDHEYGSETPVAVRERVG